jgi:Uncharacterised nucleotidyltransferase
MPEHGDLHGPMARLAVDLLSGPSGNLARGAETACRRRLAGLFLHGVETRGSPDERLAFSVVEALRGTARAEAFDAAVSAGGIGDILSALATRGLRPVVLKGRLLALQVWPRAAFRPPGDLDLLLERETVDEAIEALVGLGYVAVLEPPNPEISGVTLHHPQGRRTTVDLHWRPFRTVGRGIDPDRLLRRARPAVLEGRDVRTLDDADRLLYLMVHAAKHGFRRLTWLLDLYAVALRAEAGVWRAAGRRAIASRAARPFSTAAVIVSSLPGVRVEPEILRSIEPWWPARRALAPFVNLDAAVGELTNTRLDDYALQVLLEESVPARLGRGVYMLRRMFLDIFGAQA